MATGKKLINSPSACVDEMLEGLVLSYPGLALHSDKRVVLQREWKQHKKVALISGGGSGHEPFCAGYVGQGMLTATVAGSVFSSPPASNILHAIECVSSNNPNGALIIIPNYTGDCLNFGLAIEKARKIGHLVECVTVADDCAILKENKSCVGRRGLCGLVFVYKICGALSEKGSSLSSIKITAEKIISSMATIGVALSACSLPGAPALFNLGNDEIEIGLGVHGEAGIQRTKMCSASKAVKLLLQQLNSALSLKAEDKVAVLINNLGGSSQMEQWIIAREVYNQLSSLGIVIDRMYVGPLMTSLDMLGVQVSVLKLPIQNREEWLMMLDAQTNAPGWPGNEISASISSQPQFESFPNHTSFQNNVEGLALNGYQANLLKRCLVEASEALIQAETRLNEFDSVCGDGDCGSTLRRLADGVLKNVNNSPLRYPAALLQWLSNLAESSMGGTSGAIYSLMFTAASNKLEHTTETNLTHIWGEAWQGGIDGIMRYSEAKEGDRTLLDALIPSCKTFQENIKCSSTQVSKAIERAAEAAIDGCNKTKHMEARVGRASYVNENLLTNVDAGAYAVTVWLKAIEKELWKSFETN